MPTDKEISDLETVIQQKMQTNRIERSTLQQALTGINSVKMMSRQVVETPATDTTAAIMDGETVVSPAIIGQPAVMKTVFDVMPTDPMIPSKKMKAPRRQEIFDAMKILMKPV